ncbi:MAG: hypothetical protein IT508_10770 [Burkholderiaceae bacterium]|nr:hypothetical protein [Burkholderiaceae bacterium]
MSQIKIVSDGTTNRTTVHLVDEDGSLQELMVKRLELIGDASDHILRARVDIIMPAVSVTVDADVGAIEFLWHGKSYRVDASLIPGFEL